MIRRHQVRTAALAARASSVVVASLCAVALAPSAQAVQPKQPVKAFSVTCAGPSAEAEFGAAVVELTFRSGLLPKDDLLVLVPVNVATGFDAGDRTSVDRKQRVARVIVPADGTALTPATTVEVRDGGDVVQRIPVPAGCGVVDPDPAQGPGIGQITSTDGTVTVPITNLNGVTDDIGVSLFPVDSNIGASQFLTLAPGETGTVTFSGVAPGQYSVEAFGYTTFTQTNSGPFIVG